MYWLLVATAAYRLAQAADAGNLASATYQRLNAFLALFSIGSALPLLQGAAGGDLSPAPAAAAAAVLIGTAASTYVPAYLRSSGSADLASIAGRCRAVCFVPAGAPPPDTGLCLTPRCGRTRFALTPCCALLIMCAVLPAAGFGDALKKTFKAGRGWTGVFYSLSFWESFILGVALVGGPILPTVVSGTTAGCGCQSDDSAGSSRQMQRAARAE